MYHNLVPWILLCLLLSEKVAGGQTSPQTSKEREPAKMLIGADSPEKVAARNRVLFSHISLNEVDLLVSTSDCSDALSAGWERVRRTMPEAKQEHDVHPDDKVLSRFLGLIEGRIQCPIPLAFEATLRSAKGISRKSISFICPARVEEELKKYKPRELGDEWIIERGALSFKLPIERGMGPVDNVAVDLNDEVAYIGLYGWPPNPYQLVAVNRTSQKVIWSSKVWAAGGLKDYEGHGWHFVEIRLTGDQLIVFGVSGACAYIETFDAKTGQNRCRFSTAYFDGIAYRE
jgi:hypothetical protein